MHTVGSLPLGRQARLRAQRVQAAAQPRLRQRHSARRQPFGTAPPQPRHTAQAQAVATQASRAVTKADVIKTDPNNNVPDYIFEKMNVNLHRREGHPICTIKQAIYQYFEAKAPGKFKTFDDLFPVVSTQANFDDMLVPPDHVSRRPNDTYYVDAGQVLRCHTSAHQSELLRAGQPGFLVTGDVYRR